MARRGKGNTLDLQVAEAAIRRAVAAQTFDAAYAAVLLVYAGIRCGTQQALDAEGCGEPSGISTTVGEAIGAAILQAFDTVRAGAVPEHAVAGEIAAAAQAHAFTAIRGAVAAALAVGHSIEAAKGGKQ